jgi:hypothetical protein
MGATDQIDNFDTTGIGNPAAENIENIVAFPEKVFGLESAAEDSLVVVGRDGRQKTQPPEAINVPPPTDPPLQALSQDQHARAIEEQYAVPESRPEPGADPSLRIGDTTPGVEAQTGSIDTTETGGPGIHRQMESMLEDPEKAYTHGYEAKEQEASATAIQDRIGVQTDPVAEEYREAVEAEETAEVDLEEKTKAELRVIAADQGIDVKASDDKKAMIDKIKAGPQDEGDEGDGDQDESEGDGSDE